MNAKEHVNSLEEWLNLTEIKIPQLKNRKDKGEVYKVFKVGFALISPDDCAKKGIKAQRLQGGKSMLPTTVVELETERRLCRLPLALTSWVFDTVAQAHSGMNPFPATVEFGTIDGRIFAEIL